MPTDITCNMGRPAEGVTFEANRFSRPKVPTSALLCIQDRAHRVERGRYALEPLKDRLIRPTCAAQLLRTDWDERCCGPIRSV